MSSVAVLTPESFAEHRSGLKDQEIPGCVPEDEAYIPTYLEAFPPLPEKGAPGEKAGEPAPAWGSKIRPIKASVITQVFHVPLEERRYKDNSQFGEGEEAKVCLDIMQRTGAHIELSLAKDQGLSIMVTGKLDNVMKARKEIVARLQTQASATVAIPKEHHRFVIGKNGEKLQELELKTATKIAIPRPDDPSANIRITGTKEGIEKARHEILLISAEQDKRAVERLSLEKVFHPFIAGAHNRLVQELGQETGARISVPPPSLPKDEIVITGEKEAVALALNRIRAIYEDKKRKTTTISVEVKKSQHKYIIGPKGNTLQEILEATGVSVEMPPLDSSSETIILRGEPDKLGPALTQVYAKAKSVMVVEVTAPAWLHRFIIGKKGQNIGRITQQLPRVHIEFTDGEERICLEGPTEEVEQAQAQIQEIIKDLLVRMDYTEVIIDQRFHRHLIGKNGTNINRIKEQYKVSVRIPQDSERSNLVRIEGDPKGVQLARRELSEMVQRMENERTKDLIVDQKFHRTIIGQKGEKIKEVRDKFPEVIINFPDPAQKSDIVQLRGPKNEVEKCAKFLQKIIADLIENSFSLSVPIFKQFHKNIIGKGGANIKKIREETNTKIDLPTENSNSEMIVITGKKGNCEAARERILGIQRELANIKEAEVVIPARLHNSLIGSKGCLVRSIMDDCGGVHIHFPSEGSGSDRVTIRGPLGEVEKAKKQLLQLAEEKQVNNFTAELQAKPEYHKFLIGRGGANIRRVRDRTGARIIFPSPDDTEQELITIVGKEEAVRQAQKELENLVKNLDDVVEDGMEVDVRHHRHFVCRRGQVLRELAEEYGGVAVSFPRTGVNSQRVTLKGAKECVEAAKKRIQEIIEDLESQVTVEVAIAQRYHRAIMGPKGCRIQHITREHEVQIKFPERDDSAAGQDAFLHENGEVGPEEFIPRKCDIITISGRAEKCELAKAALLALVPITEDVEVSYELHRFIIGQKGSGIRKMMEEYEVNIWVPQPEKQLDVIKVTGLAANVERAKQGLLERVKELQAEQEDRALRSFKVTMTVDPKFHPKIIGRKGAVISQIRRDHDVNIQFPDKGDEDQDLIVISGYERNVEEARRTIQQLVAELQEMVSQDVHLDPRTHARIIGARGKAIRKLMEEFKVDIRFPPPGSDEPDKVTVMGLPDTVDNAIDHLLNLEEEYMLNLTETETLAAYMKPPSRYGGAGGAGGMDDSGGGPAKGFVVRDAPWNTSGNKAPDMSSPEDFPTFGTGVTLKQASAWGPKKF
ncbi:vigilin [Takifugu rubripes]|uniref:Vigilin n=1 Tax=Takifugu rubripes TaxID=31033 RepID=H2U6U1_TAKRU|nr:vigilin-like [Takifugu rubripes]XP_011604976.1 vigilin-like [Takifugu rubripes]XP_029696849.1 vigilin-like [Takifugu rubripes]XP_029696850.1 vigilin-like [Takifugu rubripes]|eukprot:XP_011604975.1 PREDICTED: vigilin-like [Takifugu rubripes]